MKATNYERPLIIVIALVLITGIGFLIGVFFWERADDRRQRHLVVDTVMRHLSHALEAYHADHGVYPPMRYVTDGDFGFDIDERYNTRGFPVANPTILIGKRPYIAAYPEEPGTTATPSRPIGYLLEEGKYTLFAAGPDGDYELDPQFHTDASSAAEIQFDPANAERGGDYVLFGGGS